MDVLFLSNFLEYNMPSLHVMIKPVSGACNLRCKYCFYTDEMTRRTTALYGKMSYETVVCLVRKAFIYADESISFTFQGGEPTLAGVEFFTFFIKTVNEFNVRNLRVDYFIQTNATTFTDELCALFSKHDFLVGVSLDGTEISHNTNRIDMEGNGSYDHAVKGIALLKKHGVEFNILCVVTKQVAANAYEVWKKLSVYKNIQFIPCIDSFSCEKNTFSISADEYGKFLVEIFGLYKQYFKNGNYVSERNMDNYISMLLGYPPEQCGMSGQCGLYYLCEADGSVYPCDFYVLDEWCLGNINNTSFMRMEKSALMQKFQSEGREVPSECNACEYFYICRGGCKRNRVPNTFHNRFCKSYKLFFDSSLNDMKELASELE